MSTSLKLSEELKQQAAAAAQQLGISPHAFMVEAIKQATEEANLRTQFIADAMEALDQTLSSGLAYPASEVHQYARARILDQSAAKPQAKPWRK